MIMGELTREVWGWLLGFGLCTLLALLGIAGLVVIAPLLWLERGIVGLLAPPQDANGGQHEDELRLLVESVEDARQLEADEREMISGIFGMSARPVREVMVPRIDVIAL